MNKYLSHPSPWRLGRSSDCKFPKAKLLVQLPKFAAKRPKPVARRTDVWASVTNTYAPPRQPSGSGRVHVGQRTIPKVALSKYHKASLATRRSNHPISYKDKAIPGPAPPYFDHRVVHKYSGVQTLLLNKPNFVSVPSDRLLQGRELGKRKWYLGETLAHICKSTSCDSYRPRGSHSPSHNTHQSIFDRSPAL